MKIKTAVFSLALVSFSGIANAAEDFTGSLYLPGQGKVLSNTSLDFSRAKFKGRAGGGADDNLYANQSFTYGVTNEFSVIGAIGNNFNYQTDKYNNDGNFDYEIGGKYNMESGRLVGQVGLSYYTYDPKNWYGRRTPEKWYKEVQVNAQLGYKLDGDLTPYTSFTAYNRDSFTSHRSTDYSWFAGAHKTLDKIAIDAGIRYDFATYGEGTFNNNNNTNRAYVQAEANYFLSDTVALGVFGDYLIGGTRFDNVRYDYTAGINVKALF